MTTRISLKNIRLDNRRDQQGHKRNWHGRKCAGRFWFLEYEPTALKIKRIVVLDLSEKIYEMRLAQGWRTSQQRGLSRKSIIKKR